MSENAENLCLALAVAAGEALAAPMEDLADDVRKRIGVPVERSGGRVIRSKPGEPPRRDTGRLQASVDAARIENDSHVVASVSVDTPYARKLNDQMDRPIFGDLLDQHTDAIADAVARGLAQTNLE